MTAVDLWPAEPRFEMVYNLACLGAALPDGRGRRGAPARRLRLKVRLPGSDARVPSVTGVWPSPAGSSGKSST